MGLKQKLTTWKEYAKISDLGEIARRKFFNNCFDGALTCAGLVSGMFILFLAGTSSLNPRTLWMTGLATTIAIGISGLWGAFLSEKAERKKKMTDLKKDMVILDDMEEVHEEEEIKKAMVTPIQLNGSIRTDQTINILGSKKEKNYIQKAEDFAAIVASLVDGFAPAVGSILPLLPFFIGTDLTIFHFIFSFIILGVLLVYLGIFLGNISGGGRAKYAINLVIAGIVTLLMTLFLGQITG